MNKDKIISLLSAYEKTEIVIWVENARYTEITFADPYTLAEDGNNTTFTITANNIDYARFCNQQENIGEVHRKAINTELIKTDLKDKAELKIYEWKRYLSNLLRKINMPFGESTISAGFSMKDGRMDVYYQGDERRALKYFSECHDLLSQAVLEPTIKYLDVIEKQIARSPDFNDFKSIFELSHDNNKEAVLTSLSESVAKAIFHLLKDQHKLIDKDTTEEIFLGALANLPFIDKIKWTGSKGSFRTFIRVLSNKDLIPGQPWKLIRKSFFLPQFPDFLKNLNIAASRFAVDATLEKNLIKFFNDNKSV
ncbi:MAG TPA: hypothetical protein VIL78_06720 [Hanamia sp.]|jgi:hypothetical protein